MAKSKSTALTPEEKKSFYDKMMSYHAPGSLATAGIAGGTAAAAANKRRKAMREIAKTMLATELRTNDTLRQTLDERGFEDFTEAAAVILGQLNRARAGDTEAAKFLRDTSGERPADQVAIGSFDDLPIDSIDLTELSDRDLMRLIEQRGGIDALKS